MEKDQENKVGHLEALKQLTAKLNRKDEELVLSEKKFRDFFNCAAVGMVIFDHNENKFIEVNPAFCQIIGRTKDEIINGNLFDFLAEEHVQKTKDIIEEIQNGNSNVRDFINAYKKPNGDLVWLSWSSNEIDERGINSSVAINITTEIKQQRKLKESEKKFKNFFNYAAAGMVIFDHNNGKFVDVNPAFCQMIGRTKDEVLNAGLFDFIAKNTTKETEQILADTKNKQLAVDQFINAYKKPNGDLVWISWSSNEIDENGINCNVAIDITNQVHQKAVLDENERLFKSFFEQSNAGLGIFNVHTNKFHKANETLCNWLGYSEEELLEVPLENLLGEHTKNFTLNFKGLQENAVLSGNVMPQKIIDHITDYKTKEGNTIWLKWNATRPDKNGFNYNVATLMTEKEIKEFKNK